MSDNIWRSPTNKEIEWLLKAGLKDWDVVEGPNSKAWWVVASGKNVPNILIGYWKTEKEAMKWIATFQFRRIEEVQVAVDFDMDI